MKATFQVNSTLVLEIEADSQASLFKQLADLQEVFGDSLVVDKEGNQSNKVKYVVREKDGNSFYEMVCTDADKPTLQYARRRFGMHKGKEQSLFPKSGWLKYNKQEQCEYDILTGKKVEKDKE